MRRFPAIIAGTPVEPGDWIPVTDPSTGELAAWAARCGAAEADAAVAAARGAYEGTWRHTPPVDRAAACRALADGIRAAGEELTALETLDTGKPLSQARTDVEVAARYFEFYGSTVEALFGQTLPSAPGALLFTLPEPYGVSAHIIPWNYPLQVAARTVAPALAAGNACVLKPAEDAPLSSVRLAEIAVDTGLPPGTLNVIPGYGTECGAALAAHPGIDHLSFTGSRPAGQSVMTSAAANIVPVTLELGGKSPQLVFADADTDRAVDAIFHGITEHAGQNCSAGSRLIVHSRVHDEVVAGLLRRFESMRIGPGTADLDLGPLISARQRDRVLAYIETGRGEGKLITGGTVPDGPGFFVHPTIFDDVLPGATIAQEEIFGPVLCVHSFTDPADAAAIANDTTYGLAAGIWTRDIGRAQALCRELRAGQVFVNNYSAAGGVELPFGGYRRSGVGGEKGFEALREYTRTKAVAIVSSG
ncbi:MAG: aldehyde dehydrogenase family protein [Nocardiopsaceae bacterium]|nr:aldehyde dehydrogenase family protein [Nocardiopsaceae bacterium]